MKHLVGRMSVTRRDLAFLGLGGLLAVLVFSLTGAARARGAGGAAYIVLYDDGSWGYAAPVDTATAWPVASVTNTPPSQEFATPTQESTRLPPMPTNPYPKPTETPTPGVVTATCTVTAQTGLNVRGGPGSQYAVLGVLVWGSRVPVVGEENGWKHVTLPSLEGWVSASWCT